MRRERTSEVFGYQGWRLGWIEAWAVQMIRWQGMDLTSPKPSASLKGASLESSLAP